MVIVAFGPESFYRILLIASRRGLEIAATCKKTKQNLDFYWFVCFSLRADVHTPCARAACSNCATAPSCVKPCYPPCFPNLARDCKRDSRAAATGLKRVGLCLFFSFPLSLSFAIMQPHHVKLYSLSPVSHSFWIPVQRQVWLQRRAAHPQQAAGHGGERSGHGLPPGCRARADRQLHRTGLHHRGHGHLSGTVRKAKQRGFFSFIMLVVLHVQAH